MPLRYTKFILKTILYSKYVTKYKEKLCLTPCKVVEPMCVYAMDLYKSVFLSAVNEYKDHGERLRKYALNLPVT